MEKQLYNLAKELVAEAPVNSGIDKDFRITIKNFSTDFDQVGPCLLISTQGMCVEISKHLIISPNLEEEDDEEFCVLGNNFDIESMLRTVMSHKS